MAHSYDNTLLQRMGFSDPDRRTQAHDDACIEIATDPERCVRAFKELRFLRNGKCELEVPLQKGEGKYASTVGFIDAIVMYDDAKENYSINKTVHFCALNMTREGCVSATERHQLEIDKCLAGNYPYNDKAEYRWSGGSESEWTDEHAINHRNEHDRRNRESRRNDRYIPPKLDSGSALNKLHLDNERQVIEKHAECTGPVIVSGPAELSWWTMCALVEVKTKISNVGDLLRQMNLYREYKKDHGRFGGLAISDYVVWSLDPADVRFSKLLAQQGYTLIAGPLP